MKTILLFLIVTSVAFAESYRILSIFPFNGKSHNVMFNALVRGLSERGHQVDDITHFPLKKPPKNYKTIVNLNGTLKSVVNSFDINLVNPYLGTSFLLLLWTTGIICVNAFGAHCFMGFGHIFKVPVVAVSSSVEYSCISDFIGNFDHPAFVPNALLQDYNKTKFWDRLKNLFIHHWSSYKFKMLTENIQTDYMRKYLSPDMPNIRDVERTVALTLVNSHPVILGAKPVVPSLIEVGGLHIIDDGSKLTSEMQKWLDESVDGIVYFTFGSLVLIETFPEETLNAMYKSLSKLAPMRVLMKIVDKSKLPSGLPPNVLTFPWIPQQAVLAHKNVRAFITHSGLMGSQEALYFGVPMIGIPLFGDQVRNVATFVAKNIAVKLDVDGCLKNAQTFSKLFRDRPMSAMDTAIFWIEYVIRDGPDALKSPALNVSWWQLALVDLNAFIFLSVILVLTLTFYLSRLISRGCLMRLSKKIKTQ
ncbi:UDP-glucuronosyltransferase 2B2-like [Nasonia vitripennis]|uniref:UDP-glucuronosyltransferase n=1 Tax=Nasonia vitripennis TaxID=7425 RepID=A0A7M7Q6Q9_NASVI|nr:UDP-glucuronosyltransferase 2B2-like [Nasonia vitripennis]